VAAERYRRVLAARPGSAAARLGLAEIALERGDLAAAARELEAAREADPDSPGPWLALARLARREGRRAEAQSHLEQALSRDPGSPEGHAGLAEITGDAPGAEPATEEEALALARAHPYDPRALVRAASAAARRGSAGEAVALLERAVWLFDRDRAAGEQAIARLRGLDPGWKTRRVVFVHAAADEPLRREPGWRFQLRSLLAWASRALEPVLATAFVPASLDAFDSRAAGDELLPIYAAAQRAADEPPRPGLFAAFTGRRRIGPGRFELGLAEFLGRWMAVRVAPGDRESRVLLHEILHLYGAIHVLPAVESLMNPSGDSLTLDPLNAAIAQALRERRFGLGGFEQSVLARVDLERATAAYVQALRGNLLLRQRGLADALEERSRSRPLAARAARSSQQLDPHLADVSLHVALFLRAGGRRAEAVALLELAAQLYGPDTRRGKATLARAEALRAELEALYPEAGGR
jgi:tetratricopeptide (TPR) repeat protein